LGATTVAGATAAPTRQPGGTDHTSFSWIGLPDFGFTQDPMEYQSRTHHSNMDLFDRVQAGDLMQASASVRPEMMPRVAMPKPVKKDGAPAMGQRY
jgi:carboxypeptidase Q